MGYKENIEPRDKQGRPHGKAVWYNNNTTYIIIYKHGLRHGLYKQHRNYLELSVYWNNGKQFGSRIDIDENGL